MDGDENEGEGDEDEDNDDGNGDGENEEGEGGGEDGEGEAGGDVVAKAGEEADTSIEVDRADEGDAPTDHEASNTPADIPLIPLDLQPESELPSSAVTDIALDEVPEDTSLDPIEGVEAESQHSAIPSNAIEVSNTAPGHVEQGDGDLGTGEATIELQAGATGGDIEMDEVVEQREEELDDLPPDQGLVMGEMDVPRDMIDGTAPPEKEEMTKEPGEQ